MDETGPWDRTAVRRHPPVQGDMQQLLIYRGRVVSIADRVTSTTVSESNGYTSVDTVPEVWISNAHGQELRFCNVTVAYCRVGHEVVIIGDPAKDRVLSMRNLSTGDTRFAPALADRPFDGGHLMDMGVAGAFFLGLAWFISLMAFGEAQMRDSFVDRTGPALLSGAALYLSWWLPERARLGRNRRNEALRARIERELEKASR